MSAPAIITSTNFPMVASIKFSMISFIVTKAPDCPRMITTAIDTPEII